MAGPDGTGILGVLRGGYVHPERTHRESLAGMILGIALGAQIDLDRTDAEILAMCETVLAAIRSAKADPQTMENFLRSQQHLTEHLNAQVDRIDEDTVRAVQTAITESETKS